MTVKINADTSDGLKFVSDTSGAIDFQSNGVTKMSMDSSGNLTANSFVGAGLVRLAGETLSADASSIEISASTLTTSYNNYELYVNLQPKTDGQQVFLRLRDSSAALLNTVADFRQQAYRGGNGQDFSDTSMSALTTISGVGNAAAESCFVRYSISNLRNSNFQTLVNFHSCGVPTGGTIFTTLGTFNTVTAEDNQGIQLTFASGDIASGSSYVLFGVES